MKDIAYIGKVISVASFTFLIIMLVIFNIYYGSHFDPVSAIEYDVYLHLIKFGGIGLTLWILPQPFIK